MVQYSIDYAGLQRQAGREFLTRDQNSLADPPSFSCLLHHDGSDLESGVWIKHLAFPASTVGPTCDVNL
ncbi:hypothetical protein BJX70DRAFT_377869 [Aspergillus crustosus]